MLLSVCALFVSFPFCFFSSLPIEICPLAYESGLLLNGAAEVRSYFYTWQRRFMAPLCCLTTSPPSPPPLSFFMKEGWWRIDVLVNINTALSSITKPSAINTEEWSRPSIRFSGGHYSHQPPHTHLLSCASFGLFLKINSIIGYPSHPYCPVSLLPRHNSFFLFCRYQRFSPLFPHLILSHSVLEQ